MPRRPEELFRAVEMQHPEASTPEESHVQAPASLHRAARSVHFRFCPDIHGDS